VHEEVRNKLTVLRVLLHTQALDSDVIGGAPLLRSLICFGVQISNNTKPGQSQTKQLAHESMAQIAWGLKVRRRYGYAIKTMFY
jgi:hypothetical protein